MRRLTAVRQTEVTSYLTLTLAELTVIKDWGLARQAETLKLSPHETFPSEGTISATPPLCSEVIRFYEL